MKLSRILELYLKNLEEKGRSRRYITEVQNVLARYGGPLLAKNANSVKALDWETFQQDTTNNTYNRNLTMWNGLFNYAVRQLLATSNPLVVLDRKLTPCTPRHVPDISTVEAVRSVATGVDLLWLDTSIDLAARPGELLHLPWDRVDTSASIPSVTLRTRKKRRASYSDRRLPINRELAGRLEEYRQASSFEAAFPWSYDTTNRKLSGLCSKAGVERFTPHEIRHFAAVQMELAGCPRELIQRRLGHESMATTERYLKTVSPSVEALKYAYKRNGLDSGTSRDPGPMDYRI